MTDVPPVMPPPPSAWHGVILGALFGLTMLCPYWGLVFTEASRGTTLYSTKPFGGAAGAHLFLPNDRLTKVKVLGLELALVGVYIPLESRCQLWVRPIGWETEWRLWRPCFFCVSCLHKMVKSRPRNYSLSHSFCNAALFQLVILSRLRR